jgi:hypothetical protein
VSFTFLPGFTVSSFTSYIMRSFTVAMRMQVRGFAAFPS